MSQRFRDGVVPPPNKGRVGLPAPLSTFIAAMLFLLLLSFHLPVAAQKSDWEELHARVAQLVEDGKYSEAIPVAKALLGQARNEFSDDSKQVAVSQCQLGAAYTEQTLYAEAEPVLTSGLALAEKLLNPGQPDIATCLNNLADLYDQQGRYAQAEPLYDRALTIREKALGAENPAVAEVLDNLGLLYRHEDQYEKAEAAYTRALATREKALGSEHPELATSLIGLGRLYWTQGLYEKAEPLYKRALAIQQKALRPEHPKVASTLSGLAELYLQRGKYAEAEPLYKRALQIREKALGPTHRGVAQVLNGLAMLYWQQGRFPEAEPLYKRALAIAEASLGPSHPEVATALNNLAVLYVGEGRAAEAEPLYKRSLAIVESNPEADRLDLARSLHNLAELYEKLGRFREAESYYKRALPIWEQMLGPEHPNVAATLNNLAELYRGQGRYEDAEPLYLRALEIQEKTLGEEHSSVATTLGNLGALYSDEGDYANAETYYRLALLIRVRVLGSDHPGVALSLNNLAHLSTLQGKYAEAEPLLERALAIEEKSLGPEHPAVRLTLMNLAASDWARELPAKAAPLYARALSILAKQFDDEFVYMSEKERLLFLNTVSGNIPAYFGFCLSYREKFPELAGKMYDVVLWQKGFVAQSAAALRAKIREGGDVEAVRLLDELTAKKSARAKLAGAAVEGDAEKQAARRTQLEQLEKETNDLERELVKRSGVLGEEKRLAQVTWQQVRNALKPDEAAVEIVRFPFFDGKKWTDTNYYVALVVTAPTTTPQFVVLGEQKKLEAAPLTSYRSHVGRTRGVITAETTEVQEKPGADSANSGAAYDAFWKPLVPTLSGAKRVYVSSDGALNQIPLGLLADSKGQLLLEKYDLRIVNSTKDLLRPQHTIASKTALLVGNPKFDLTEPEQRAALEKLNVGVQDRPLLASAAVTDTGLRSRDARGGPLNPLPATQIEIDAVGKLLKDAGWQIAPYTGERALEEVLDRARSPRVLHVATHGFFLSDQEVARRNKMSDDRPSGLEDPMLRSGLYFAGADRAESGAPPVPGLEDGVLTAYEATQLNLQGTELVVLSACETGLGEQKNGEGVFGLRRGLQEAGAESVLMSMWSVPDKETQELMALFYQKWLGGLDKHEALRLAQLNERETVRQRYGKDLPFYWGAFVLVGR